MEENLSSLFSSVEEKGENVTQIIVFSNGNKKTFQGIKTKSIRQGEFTHFDLLDGRRIFINSKNVDFFEVIPEKKLNDEKNKSSFNY